MVLRIYGMILDGVIYFLHSSSARKRFMGREPETECKRREDKEEKSPCSRLAKEKNTLAMN